MVGRAVGEATSGVTVGTPGKGVSVGILVATGCGVSVGGYSLDAVAVGSGVFCG